mmetsp:Transcript_104251/g.280133  ORF Transcript_104251/g.280133 Transcript_104251/m.280133 type:complete len:296 (+) Transcript_104251:251-1138(+)
MKSEDWPPLCKARAAGGCQARAAEGRGRAGALSASVLHGAPAPASRGHALEGHRAHVDLPHGPRLAHVAAGGHQRRRGRPPRGQPHLAVHRRQGLDDAPERGSLPRVLRPTGDHDVPELNRQLLRHRLKGRPRPLLHELLDFLLLPVLEGGLPGEHLEHNDPVGVDVDLLVVASAVEHLWGHPVDGAHERRQRLPVVGLHDARQAEVGHLDDGNVAEARQRLGEQEVEGLEVPVDDLRRKLVQVVHPVRYVGAHLDLLHQRQIQVPLVVQHLEEGASLAILAHQVLGCRRHAVAE